MDERLITGEPEAIFVRADYRMGEGWVLRASVRRQFESWKEAPELVFGGMTTDELEQLLEDLSHRLLKLRHRTEQR